MICIHKQLLLLVVGYILLPVISNAQLSVHVFTGLLSQPGSRVEVRSTERGEVITLLMQSIDSTSQSGMGMIGAPPNKPVIGAQCTWTKSDLVQGSIEVLTPYNGKGVRIAMFYMASVGNPAHAETPKSHLLQASVMLGGAFDNTIRGVYDEGNTYSSMRDFLTDDEVDRFARQIEANNLQSIKKPFSLLAGLQAKYGYRLSQDILVGGKVLYQQDLFRQELSHTSFMMLAYLEFRLGG